MRRFVIPVLDQGLVAAFNLTLQLALVRLAAPQDYGLFVLWQALIMVLVGFQDAAVGVPLALRIAWDRHNARRLVLERQLARFATLFVLTAGGVLCAGAALARGSPGLAAAIGLYGAAFLTYMAVRSLAQSRAAFSVALAVDALYAAASLVALAILAATGTFALPTLFGALIVPPVTAAVVGLALCDRPPRPGLRRALAGYKRIWRDTRWTVAACLAAEVQARAFIVVLAALHGPAAVATVFAAGLVLRHLVMLTVAWTAFARPFLVRLRDRGDSAGMVRFAAGSALGLVGLYGVNLVGLALAWPLIDRYVFVGEYHGLWPIVVSWTLVYSLQVPVNALAVCLVALGSYRADAAAVMIGAGVTLCAVTVLALTAEPAATLYGMMAGTLVTATLMARRLAMALRAPPAAPPAAPVPA